MSVLVEICGSNNSETKNTGASKQCLEGATVRYALAKGNFAFASKEDFKDKAKWNEAKKNKDIVPFYSIEANLENSNTEPTYYESRTLKIETKAARKGKKFTHHLGLCSHSALKSYENSEYTRVFEFTEDGYIKGVLTSEGKVQGQLLNNFNVGIRKDATLDTPPSTDVEFVYSNYKEFEDNGIISEPNFDLDDFEGIYPLMLEVVGTPTATELVVKALAGCEGAPVTGLAQADFKFLKADGTTQNVSGVTATENTYTINGTGFVSGTIATVVVEKTNIMYEAEKVTVTV
ncbi:hypothetical protein PL373_16835 [Tenacibaculum maritimum]|nr:hypothetical protein [Tenacibaculum maritimum]MDB0602762.1 hypothetical protein [Tenacibaculum maritimum]MDB0612364.1 hypothetical protein [Tenacibaculum maritimum]